MFKKISIGEKLLYKSNCKMIKKMHGKNKNCQISRKNMERTRVITFLFIFIFHIYLLIENYFTIIFSLYDFKFC